MNIFAFRKKPVVIEAFRLQADDGTLTLAYPQWFMQAIRDSRITPAAGGAIIHTLEGDMQANNGDWIICGVQGELYPCKDDIFQATYEKA